MKKSNHKEKSFQERLDESKKILSKYPERACLFIEKMETCKDLPDLNKNKYLVPKSITAAELILVIRNRIKIPKEKAIFFYVNKTIISGNITINEINENNKNDDGFLYIKYTGEDCFG